MVYKCCVFHQNGAFHGLYGPSYRIVLGPSVYTYRNDIISQPRSFIVLMHHHILFLLLLHYMIGEDFQLS